MSGSESRKKAIVIGSGFGGLAVAVRLQAAGLDVTVVEKREKIGGRAYQLVEGGYVFDMGPSLITAPGILDSVFQAAGRRLEDYVDLVPLDPYYRIHFHDGTWIDYVGDQGRMQEQMRAFDPGDAERLPAFMDAVRPIYDAVIGERMGSQPFDTVGSMVRFIPRVLRMGAHRPVASIVHRYFRDFRHRFLYSFHPLFLGGDPFSAPGIYLMIPYLERSGGVWFSRGGMYSVVEALGRVFTEIGGTIRTGSEVSRILTRNGRAVGVRVGEETLAADLVVSNADVAHTYARLLDGSPGRRWSRKKIESADYSMSCFVLYLGVKKAYPELRHHTLILTERYRELVRDIFRRKVLPDDFSLYLHVPTRTDPSMAPEGCESMYVLAPAPNLDADVDWERMGPVFARRILAFLEEWGLEGLQENVEVLSTFTPADFASELNAFRGNAFSLEPKLTQTAWFRPHNRSEDVEGLYLVGAGTHPGAGVPGVVLSAEATYGCIAADLGLPDQWDWGEPGRAELEGAGLAAMPT